MIKKKRSASKMLAARGSPGRGASGIKLWPTHIGGEGKPATNVSLAGWQHYFVDDVDDAIVGSNVGSLQECVQ